MSTENSKEELVRKEIFCIGNLWFEASSIVVWSGKSVGSVREILVVCFEFFYKKRRKK